MGNTLGILARATLATSIVFSSGAFAAPAAEEFNDQEAVTEQTQESTCTSDLVQVFKCTGKTIGSGTVVVVKGIGKGAETVGKESYKYVVKPAFKYVIRPVGIGTVKLAKAIGSGTVYVVVHVKDGAVAAGKATVKGAVYASKAVGKAAVVAGKFSYNAVVNIAIKKVIYEYGLKRGVYGLFLKPVGKGIYQVSVVVYKEVLTPVGHGLEAAGRAVVKAVRFYIQSFDDGNGKQTAEVSELQELSPDQITEESIALP